MTTASDILDGGPGFALSRERQGAAALAATLALFALACLVLWWPWLSGAVTIPWDAKSQFLPPERFLADALARGDSPFWAPSIFGGWPQIADPQSLIFSPLHFLLAWFVASPSFRRSEERRVGKECSSRVWTE